MHQMWRDHPFSQRKKTIKRVVGCSLKATGKGRGWKRFEKGVAGVDNIGGGGGLNKIVRVRNPVPTM